MNKSTCIFAGVSSLALLLALGVSAPAVAANSGCTPDQPSPGDCTGVYKNTGEGDASGGNVTINDTVTGNVNGGYAWDGAATNNSVTLNDTVIGDVNGGYAWDGAVTNNSVTLNDIVTGNVNGGYAWDGAVTNNRVTLNDYSIVGGDVRGGNSNSGNVSGNSVILNGTNIVGIFVYGGSSDSGTVSGNSVILNGTSTVREYVYGGWANSGTVSGNSVILNGSSRARFVFGGNSDSGNVGSNNITLNGGSTVDEWVYGGNSDSGTVSGNSVILNGTSTAGTQVAGGLSGSGNVIGNSVILNGTSTAGTQVAGGLSGSGNVIGNSVILNDNSTVGVQVSGGQSGSGNVSGNSVILNGNSTVQSEVVGGWTNSGMASGNSVILNGARRVGGDVVGGQSTSGTASGNSVTINGGTMASDIYGGRSAQGAGDATGNSVTINGGSFSAGTILYGGGCSASIPSCLTATKDFRTGNSLTLSTTATVKGAENFQHFNFALNRGLVGQTLLTTTDAVVLTPTGKAAATVGFEVQRGETLQVGDSFTLINKTDGSTFGHGNTIQQQLTGLTLRDYGVAVSVDSAANNALAASITGISAAYATPQAASLGDATVASLGMMNTAADFAAGDGMREARSIAGLDSGLNAGDGDTMRGGAFAAVTGGQLRYRANGRTTVDGMSLLGGFSVGIPLSTGQAMAGVFVESGWGSYKGRSKQDISSNGNTRYVGGGVLGRYELDGFYVEGSGRIGRTENQYNSSLSDGAGNTANYKRTNTYYGLHGGLGYVLPVTNAINVDLSTKYFWTHQTGNNVSVLNDPVKIDAANSHRWRTGARVNAAVATGVVPYVGAYYEHEFDAKAKMTTVGLNIPGPSMKGGTGVAELGVTFGAPTDIYKVDVGVTGYAGKYSGATGSVKAKWAF